MAARVKLKFKEIWPAELVAMSNGKSSIMLKPIVKKILSYYDGVIPDNSPE
jgi:hypothetical protein